MLHTFFAQPKAQRRMLQGPLGLFVNDHAAHLHDQGYSRESIRRGIRVVAAWSQWIQNQSIAVKDLNADCIRRYLHHRSKSRRPDYSDRPSLHRFLAWLQEKRIIPQPVRPKIPTPGQPEEDAFQSYLSKERGLSPGTVVNYLYAVRRLLKDRFGHCPIRLSTLCAKDIVSHVQRQASRLTSEQMRTTLTGLRAFLRYLRHRGMIPDDLAIAVPQVPYWKLSTLPKFIEASEVERLLHVCRRSTPAGRRNYAILLLLARLGLRAGEIVNLRLDDIDWAVGELIVRGKGERTDRLPLPHDVGQAVAAYLKKDRPTYRSRNVFLLLRAPYTAFSGSGDVSAIVQRALKKAGIEAPRTGAHLLRHSLATAMLRRGASLPEIGQLLRHQQINTTTIYAKVDLVSLQGLARRWPGGAS